MAEPILEKLDERRILRTIDAAPGEKTPRFEIRHDVLAGAVVEWERQYEETKRRAADEQRQREELEEERRRQRTRMLLGGAIALAFLIPAVLGAVWIVKTTRDAQAQRDRFHSTANAEQAVGQIAAADPAASVQLGVKAYDNHHAVPDAEEALRSALAASHLRAVMSGYGLKVAAARFSPNGKLVATASPDGSVRVWNAAEQRLVRVLVPLVAAGGTPPAVNNLAFSPDGSLLATASADGKARLWAVPTGRLVRTLAGHRDSINNVSFSRDGRLLLTAGFDWTPRVWHTDRRSHPLAELLSGHTGPILGASFSPDGSRAVTASTDGTARIWFLGHPHRSLILRAGVPLLTASFSPDGRTVVTGGSDGTGRIWNAQTGRPLGALLKGHAGPIDDAEFSPTGRLVVTAGSDGTTRLWQTGTGAPAGVLKTGTTGKKAATPVPVLSASFSPDGAYILTAQGPFARIWRTDGRNLILRFRGHKQNLETASFSPDESRVVTASDDGTARVWDTGLAKPVTVLPTGRAVADIALGPDPGLAAVASRAAVQIWELGHSRLVRTLPGGGRSITSVAISPDGKLVAATATDGTTQVFQLEDGRLVASVSAAGPARDVAFSPNGKLIVVGYDRGARVWRIADRSEHEFATDSRVAHVAFSRDGRQALAAVDPNGKTRGIFIEDLDGWKEQRLAPTTQIVDASFGPNGTIVAGTDDGAALIWSSGARLIRTMRGSRQPLVSAWRSDDGRFVVTAGADGRARVWESLSGRLLLSVYEGPSLESAELSSDGRFLVTDTAGRARVHPCEVCLPIKTLYLLGHWDQLLGEQLKD